MSISTYGVANIKKEIQHLPHEQLAELCMRLVRYKKENKELLAYLLFEVGDEQGFTEKVKAEASFMLSQLPSQSYLAAKSIRKILRLLAKYTKFISSKTAEIDLLISFCQGYVQYVDKKVNYKPMRQILVRQLEKIRTLIAKLHEDLQFDYTEEYNLLHKEAEAKFSWLYR